MTLASFYMRAKFEQTFAMLLPMLRDGKHKEQHEAMRANLLHGCSIIPLSSTVREEIGEVFNLDLEELANLEDEAVVKLAFHGLDDPRVLQALLFHAGIISAVFTSMDQRN